MMWSGTSWSLCPLSVNGSAHYAHIAIIYISLFEFVIRSAHIGRQSIPPRRALIKTRPPPITGDIIGAAAVYDIIIHRRAATTTDATAVTVFTSNDTAPV